MGPGPDPDISAIFSSTEYVYVNCASYYNFSYTSPKQFHQSNIFFFFLLLAVKKYAKISKIINKNYC